MAKDNDKKPLSRKFQSFSFDDAPARTPQKPASEKPSIDDVSHLKYERYRGTQDASASGDEEDDDFELRRAYAAEQERAFEAARGFLPRRRQIRDALDIISNLDMQAVIAAGIIEETYRKRLPDQRVDDMIVAALCADADNFDDITDRLTPEAVGMVDELRMLSEEGDDKRRLTAARQLEVETKRVFLATAIADLDMLTYEMDNDTADAIAPSKQEHDLLAELIMATTYGVENPLIVRAVTSYNAVSRAAGLSTLLEQDARHEVNINPFADVKIENAGALDAFTASALRKDKNKAQSKDKGKDKNPAKNTGAGKTGAKKPKKNPPKKNPGK